MKLRVTITKDFDIGEGSAFCTELEYREFKADSEWVYDVFSDELHDEMAYIENWKIEEIP